jgi:AmmeMemoRadiSam system protein B
MSEQRVDVALELGKAIAEAFRDQPVLLVASTDFTHYRPKAFAEKQDKFALAKILTLDPVGLMEEVTRRSISMCGSGAVAAVLEAGRRLGCEKAELANYVTSGDVTGDQSDVVAYASVVIR